MCPKMCVCVQVRVVSVLGGQERENPWLAFLNRQLKPCSY